MTPTALVNALENNSRQAEQQLREAEQALYMESDQQARLEHLISSKLTEIASLQLQIDPEQNLHTRQLLEQREQARATLGQELEKLERLIAHSLEKQQQVQQNLAQLDGQAQSLLEQDPAFAQLLEQLEAALQAEQQAHAGYDDIRDECAGKLLGYQGNQLYQFLKTRQYGTEQYRPYPFQRALDDYVARKVDFRANHANEQILLTMQARNETLRQARGEAREQLQAQHQQLLEKARETAGMHTLMAEEQRLDALLGEFKTRASSLQGQLSDFAQQRDPQLLQIRQDIADRLRARPLAELIVEAAKTPNERDDVLVSELQLLHARLREIQHRMNGAQAQANTMRRFYDRAKTIEYALRDDHYRDPRHEYELRQPIEQILADYMSGQLDQAAVQQLLDAGRQYVPSHRRGDSWTPGSTRSQSWGGVSSSSGGGGFRTTSSSGGGGFRTTDSF